MTVVSFRGWTPPARFDELPWTDVKIQEAATELGAYSTIETVALDPVDSDPSEPEARDFTTEEGTGDELWYRLIWVDATLDESQPTSPIQNVAADSPYATTTELADILKVNHIANFAALQRVLMSASLEIDSELDLVDPMDEVPDLVVEVCLERAVEHWQQMKSPFGVIGLGGVESVATFTGQDTWKRHANKLAPLKEQWGLA